MKKLLLVALLMLALVITAVACNGNETVETTAGETTATQTPATAEPDDSTAAPETPTEAPTAAPENPTDAPDTQAPEVPTDAPVTQAPVVTTEPETEAPVDPMAPINVFEAADIQTITGGDPSNLTQDCVSIVDNYLHIVPIGADPYWYPFASVDGGRYVAIRYRTDATGADMQLYIASSGNGPSDDTTMIRLAVVADGEWHLAVFDTQSLIDAGKYDGEYVSYFRFDPLEAGYMLNEEGEPYKNEDGTWARHTLPEGCYIDVEYIAFFNSAEAAEAYDFELHPAFVEKEEAGMKGHSFDTFYVNGAMYFPEDGGASDKLDAIDNTVIFGVDEAHDSMLLRGWIGFEQAIEAFGYYIDDPYTQTFGEFKTATEDAVIGIAGEHATRFEVLVPLAELERGTHTVGFVVKLADGTVARLRTEITVVIPTNYENLTVPQDQWVITGHNTNLNDSSNPMVAAGGVESAALLHQGSIYLGELDLSKYSKVVVMWGCDNSGVTQGHYDANANNRIMLLNAVMDGVMSPAEETIIAGGTYELGGWAVQAFEIDLTNVSYNGPVYVAIDALPGTFALFASVEFIGAEIPAAPETPDEPDSTGITVDGDFADWADKVVTEIPVSKFIAWTGTAPEAFTLKTSFTSDGEYLYVYLNAGENSGATMYQICLITDNTVASDAAQAWYNVTFADGVASIAGVSGACKGEPKVFMTGTEVEAAIPIAAIYGEGFALPVETRILLVAQINGGTHMGTFHDGKNPNDDGWADRTGDGCPLTLNADGSYTIDLPKAEEPEEPEEPVENYNVPMESWTISGHQPQLITPDVAGIGPIVAAAGMEKAALIHQGSVGVGAVDLSKYSKVVIQYTTDASQPTYDLYNASGKQIYVLNAQMHMVNSPDAATVITSATFALPELNQSWKMQTIEIDLSAIDYSGDVFIAWDTLAGSFMVIASVEFIA